MCRLRSQGMCLPGKRRACERTRTGELNQQCSTVESECAKCSDLPCNCTCSTEAFALAVWNMIDTMVIGLRPGRRVRAAQLDKHRPNAVLGAVKEGNITLVRLMFVSCVCALRVPPPDASMEARVANGSTHIVLYGVPRYSMYVQ
jgi:hypothetical protein